jgi:hypothetical protein
VGSALLVPVRLHSGTAPARLFALGKSSRAGCETARTIAIAATR